MKLNEDGKLLDRVITGMIGAVAVVVPAAFAFYAETRTIDARQADAIARLNIDMISLDTRTTNGLTELRKDAAADRRDTSELKGDVKALIAISQRIESRLDRDNRWPPAPTDRGR